MATPAFFKSHEFAEMLAESRRSSETTEQVVISVLRTGVLSRSIPPGTRLRQEDVARSFRTGRISVREALRALEYEGLVRTEAHRGFTVTDLDVDDVEIYDLRSILEGHAIRLAVPLLTEADLRHLETLYQQLTDAGTADERIAARDEFHRYLYAIGAGPRLMGMIDRLRNEVARILRENIVDHSAAHHDIFYDAIMSGDAESASAELATHFRRVASLLRRYLREERRGGTSTLGASPPARLTPRGERSRDAAVVESDA